MDSHLQVTYVMKYSELRKPAVFETNFCDTWSVSLFFSSDSTEIKPI